MGRLFILLIALTALLPAQSQNWVGFSIGGNQTFIDFRNASGQKSENLKGIPSFTATAHFQAPFQKLNKLSQNGKTLLNLETGFKSSKIQDIRSSQQTNWTLSQLTVSMTIRKHARTRSDMFPFYEIGGGFDYMLRGTQTHGFEQFDLSESLYKTNFSLVGGIGLQYEISYDANCTLLLSYQKGLSNLEKDLTQTAKLSGLRIAIAIYFTIEKAKKR